MQNMETKTFKEIKEIDPKNATLGITLQKPVPEVNDGRRKEEIKA